MRSWPLPWAARPHGATNIWVAPRMLLWILAGLARVGTSSARAAQPVRNTVVRHTAAADRPFMVLPMVGELTPSKRGDYAATIAPGHGDRRGTVSDSRDGARGRGFWQRPRSGCQRGARGQASGSPRRA